MRASFLVISALLLTHGLHAQLANRIWAAPEDLKALSQRTLVVEMPEENPKVVELLTKQEDSTELKSYRDELQNYRDLIEEAIEENWKYNTDIEFKSTSEIIDLFRAKSSKHVVMLKMVMADGAGITNWYEGLSLPALILTRTDGEVKFTKSNMMELRQHDYQMYFLRGVAPDGSEAFTPASLAFSLRQAQKHLEWAGNQKKPVDYSAYCKEQAELNCSKMGAKRMVMEEKNLYKDLQESEARVAYGRDITFVPHDELDELYVKKADDVGVLYSFPMGTIARQFAYMKVIVDPSTDEVLEAYVPGIGSTIAKSLMKLDLKDLGKCK